MILVQGKSLKDFSKLIGSLQGIEFESLWSINFFCENIVNVKKLTTQHPENYEGAFLNIVFRNPRKQDIEGFRVLVQGCGLKILDKNIAEEEWDKRYNLLDISRVKKNLIAGEIIIPSAQFDKLQKFVSATIEGEVGLMGHYCGKEAIAVILIYLGDDLENNSWLKALEAFKFQELGAKLDGKPYGTGLYFTHLSEVYFGREGLETLWHWKKATDPLGIMNPGKVFPPSLDSNSPVKDFLKVLKYGRLADNILGRAGRFLASNRGETETSDGLICTKCGYCRHVCPIFRENPWETNNPRGKIFLLRQRDKYQEITEFLNKKTSDCLRCFKCIEFCQVQNQGWFAYQGNHSLESR